MVAGLARWRADRASLVARVLDGDTLLLATGETVRLIGIDAPETEGPYTRAEPFGERAAAFARRLAEGRRVRLEFDRERRDRYGRTLAYVVVGDLDLNAALLRAGYARAYRRFPHRRLDEFLALEREARAGRRGMWADPRVRQSRGGFLRRGAIERRVERTVSRTVPIRSAPQHPGGYEPPGKQIRRLMRTIWIRRAPQHPGGYEPPGKQIRRLQRLTAETAPRMLAAR